MSKYINGFALTLTTVGGILGFIAAFLLFKTEIVSRTWTAMLFTYAGALLGFVISVVIDRTSPTATADISEAILGRLGDAILVIVGITLITIGVEGRTWWRVREGIICLFAPLAYWSSKREDYSAAVIVFGTAAVCSLATFIIIHQVFWLIVTVLCLLASAGYFVGRRRQRNAAGG